MFQLTYKFATTLYTIILFFTGATITGCTPQPSASDDPTSQIRERWDLFIKHWENEAARELAAFYTLDGINIPSGFSVSEGQEAIESFYTMLFDAHASSRYKHQIERVDHEGNSAVEYGTFTVNWTRNDGSTWTFSARSLTHWVKNDDGIWQIKTLLFNNPPDATSE